MSEMELIEAVRAGNHDSCRELIEAGADVNQQDKQGWTPLCWAAARGDVAAIELLLSHGADASKTGRDLRTPQMIALAAGQAEAVKALRRASSQTDGEPERQYCAAYQLGELRRFDGWQEHKLKAAPAADGNGNGHAAEVTLDDSDVVFIHQDYKVTRSMWQDEEVIFDQVSDGWKEFCTSQLGFAVPDGLDLIPPPAEGGAADDAPRAA